MTLMVHYPAVMLKVKGQQNIIIFDSQYMYTTQI